MYQEESRKNKINPIILIITGLIAVTLVIIFFVQMLEDKKKEENYITDYSIPYIEMKVL